MSQQLVKKGANGKHENVMPRSWIEDIKDKNTGQTLVEILQGFNMYFLSYNGNTSSTRCLVPTMLRKKGLWITYVKYDGNVYTEWYAADKIDDKSWGDSSNWRVGNNTLVGDITISSNGNWVINGTETEFKAVGEKGNTPLVRFDSNNKFQVSYNNGEKWLDISDSITNNLRIKKYIGINESLPTSGVEEGTIYMKGPYYAEDDTFNNNPIYRIWVYSWKNDVLSWIDNGEFTSIAAGVVQETGDSETEVMSQKAVTEKLSELGSEVKNLIGEGDIQSGFYDKNVNYQQSEGFCCLKTDISNALSVRVKAYAYGNAAITLTDETNSILYQITDNYSTNAFLINVKDYVGAKWLYLSNTTSYVPSNEVIVEAVKLNESISVSIANLVNELINNNEAISDLSESFESMADNLASIEQTIEGIVGGTKTIDTSNGLVFQRKSYLDATGNIAAAGSDGWYISKYYPIDNVNRIELYARANWGFSVCAICDENKNVISTLTGIGEKKSYEITEFPEGAKYIIFHSTESDSYVIFEKKSKIKEKSLKDKNVLIIGDSISTGTSSQKRNPNWTSYGSYDKWVDRLIATGFFSDEKTYNCSWHATGFVADQNGAYDSFVKRLKAIAEPSKYEYVIVFGGINDWIKSVSMEDFKAKVDEFFLYLINNFTTARIVVITPLQCYNYEVASRYEKNNAGLYQKDYADYIEEVCEKYAFPVLDFRRYSGFCPINETFRNRWTLVTANPDGGYWPADGTHPIKEFEDNFMAPNIQNFIEKFM